MRPCRGRHVLAVAVACFGASETVSAADAAVVRAKVRAWRQANEASILREFVELLALPNLASDAVAIRRNAEHIAGLLQRRGVTPRLLELEGMPPAVFGERRTPGARRTILVYVHYDGQPVSPERWKSRPWTPVLRKGALEDGAEDIALEGLTPPIPGDWRLYARSASDDKAPIAAFLAALDALAAAGIPPSVNLKFLFEGEEEAGSPHMRPFLERYKQLLDADAWILCDGPVHQTRRMQVFFGARGTTGLELTVYGPARPLHSGHYGNWAPNPASALAHLLSGLRDTEGGILIPGFYDDVRPPTEAERQALAAAPDVDGVLRRELALGRTEGKAPLAERILQPALNLRGLEAGAVAARAANAIPAEARASIDFRLVPDQTPARVREQVEAHLRAQGWTVVHDPPDRETLQRHPRVVRLEWDEGYPAARTSMSLPASRAVIRAVSDAVGGDVVSVPTLGGSVPMYLFSEIVGRPVIGLPIANHDNNQHAADENIRLQNLWDGIEMYAGLIARLGQVWE